MTRERVPLLLSSAVVVLFGCAWCSELLSAVNDDVLYSGDGGLKALMVRQLLAGRFVPWLDLHEPAWVRHLWDQGMYPFRPPFVHRVRGHWYPSFEWTFPAISAPFYALFGVRGLYVLPTLATVAVWARLVWLLAQLRIGWVAAATSLALVVFASPLTFYAATFWEHTPAVALAFFGYTDLLINQLRPRRLRAARSGLLLGLSAWLRPEALVFGSIALLVHLPTKRWRENLVAAVAFGATVACWAATNWILYDAVAGIHSMEVLDHGRSAAEWTSRWVGRARRLRRMWFEYVPFTWVALVLSGASLVWRGRLASASRRAGVVAILAFAGIVTIVPNHGGLEIGPRYLLLLIPLVALVVALGLQQLRGATPTARWTMIAALIAVGGVSAHENMTTVLHQFRRNYSHRIAPSVRAIRRLPRAGILFGHDWAAMEMANVIDERPIVTVRSMAQVDRAVEAMVRHGHDVVLVDGPGRRRLPVEARQQYGSVRVRWTKISDRGEYDVLHGVPITGRDP